MNSLKIKKNDKVVVLSGKDKGKSGKVLGTVPSERKVVVEGINVVTCHGSQRAVAGFAKTLKMETVPPQERLKQGRVLCTIKATTITLTTLFFWFSLRFLKR